ncbi:enoyl-CoA hydratase/isomerase family protein [Microvirga sp. P5_D2]
MSNRDCVTYRVDGRAAYISLARPGVLNAINEDMCRQLSAVFDELEKQPDISIAVISGGEARAFSAGADLTFMRGLSGESLRRFIELTWLVFDRIARSPLLSIASLHGYALGGGAELALACDMRVADEDTRIGFPEMTLGSVPGSGAVQRLPQLIGPSRAVELIVSGRRVGGREAEVIGLVNKTVETGQSLLQATKWAETFAARPPEAIRYLKTAIRLPPDASVAPMLHGLVSSICQSVSGYRERTSGFADKHGNASAS